MQVTDAMVAAAQDATPRWMNATDSEIRYIIEAALTVAGEIAVDVTANVRIQIDETEFRDSVADAVERLSSALPRNAEGRVTLATLHGGRRSVEVNLGGDMVPHLDGATRVVRTRPRGDAGGHEVPGNANPQTPLPPMVIPDNHPMFDTSGFEDVAAATTQRWMPVTRPCPLATADQLYHHLGIGEVAMARMIRFRDDYKPPTPLPIHEATTDSEALYDPEEVKAWYEALPKASDG